MVSGLREQPEKRHLPVCSYRTHVYAAYGEAISKASDLVLAHAKCAARHRLEPTGKGSYTMRVEDDFHEYLSEVKIALAALKDCVEVLVQALPEQVRNTGNLHRHLYFSRHWLDKDEPWSCIGDASDILSRDLPAVLDAFELWYTESSHLDQQLLDRLKSFDKVTHVNSSVREAWAIFKTRCVEEFGLSARSDGSKLAGELFGGEGATKGLLENPEREGYLNLALGLYALSRNPLMHNDLQPNPAVADAVLVLIGHMLNRLSDVKEDAKP